jgi:hypothetical protein
MFNKGTYLRKNAVSGFRWLCLFLFLFLSYWWVMTNFAVRDFWDPPYVAKSELLKARMRQYPGHPLWLIMGSSRVDEGLRPGVFAGRMQSADAPLIFNFGMGGADMFRQLVSLRRLVADGVKPRRVGIEIVGVLMDRQQEMFADEPRLLVRARPDELDELCGYAAGPGATRGHWLQSRLNPFYQYGMGVPGQTLSLRLLPLPGLRRFESRPYDDWGWFAGPGAPPVDVYYKGLESARKEYENDFGANFAVSPKFDRALRATLDFCRDAGIDVFLLQMPEAADFQVFYTAQANTAIECYLWGIVNAYGVRLIDARSWLPGRDNFIDGHHLNATGAETFTRRFAGELSNK